MSILVDHLYKSYGTQLVLNDISFNIGSGEIVAFLGNNGAGKSTTMKIINGYLSPDSGRVEVCGLDVAQNPQETHRLIGYLPEHNPIYPDMFVREYLLFIAGVYHTENPASKVDEMIERTGLTHEFKKKIGMLSKGYRQRVGLAQALIPDPQVLILDEPTTGLDPNQIVEVRNLIKEIGKEKTVMLSTHIMQEVSAICDRVIILNDGKIAVDGKESAVVSKSNKESLSTFIEFQQPTPSLIDTQFLKEIDGIDDVMPMSGNTFLLSSKQDVRDKIFRSCAERNLVLLTLKLQEKSMEEVFRSVTEKKEPNKNS